MPRRKIDIPFDDINIKIKIKGLQTLIKEGKVQEEIAEYYRGKGINVDQTTISRRIAELNEEQK